MELSFNPTNNLPLCSIKISKCFFQVGLGIATLLFYVPVPLASLHQCGALVTLSSALWLSHELKLMKALKHVPK